MDEIPVMAELGRVPIVGARLQSALPWVLTGLISACRGDLAAAGYRRERSVGGLAGLPDRELSFFDPLA